MYTESKEKRRCFNEMIDRHTYVSKHQKCRNIKTLMR